MRVLYCGSGWFPIIDLITAGLPEDVSLSVWQRNVPLTDAVRDIQVILPSNAVIGADVVAAARGLLLIQQPAAGVDGIDLAAAASRNIPVCNAPGANHVSVAETALLLILALARRLPEAARCFAERRIGVPCGRELAGKTLGIIGMGRSGAALAARARGLEMEILATTSRSAEADWQTLFVESDVISIHCPLTAHTRGLIDARALAAMKPGVLLVNCGRGAVIERAALNVALDSGHVGGVGLDTFWEEPWDPSDPLFARDNVVALPHVAGSSEESFARIAAIVCGNIDRLRRGQALVHRVA